MFVPVASLLVPWMCARRHLPARQRLRRTQLGTEWSWSREHLWPCEQPPRPLVSAKWEHLPLPCCLLTIIYSFIKLLQFAFYNCKLPSPLTMSGGVALDHRISWLQNVPEVQGKWKSTNWELYFVKPSRQNTDVLIECILLRLTPEWSGGTYTSNIITIKNNQIFY